MVVPGSRGWDGKGCAVKEEQQGILITQDLASFFFSLTSLLLKTNCNVYLSGFGIKISRPLHPVKFGGGGDGSGLGLDLTEGWGR